MRKKIKLAVLGISVTAVIAGSACNMADSNYKPMMEKASSYMKNEDIDSAFRCYDIASKLKPNEAEPMIKMADIYLTRQFYDKAEETINQAITLAPDNAEVYRQQMKLYIAYEQGEEAYNALTRAKECGKPEITQEEYLQLGALLSNQGFADQAIGCFEEGSVENMTAEQQISYWMALKAVNRDDEIASLGLIEPGSEKMPANFDEQFQNGTIQLTKTQVGQEFFEQDENVNLISSSPDGKYGIFEDVDWEGHYFLYNFEMKKEIVLWANTAKCVEGTQERLQNFVDKYESKFLKTAVWSADSSYIVLDFNSMLDDRAAAFKDAYVIDPQTGGCWTVKSKEEVGDSVSTAPFYHCTTDKEGNVYYIEIASYDGSYTIKQLNIETREEKTITTLSRDEWNMWGLSNNLIYTKNGKLVGAFEYEGHENDTDDVRLITWKQTGNTWEQSEKIICTKAYGNSKLYISDSGKGIFRTGVHVVVFDIESEDDSYAIIGTKDHYDVSFERVSVEDAENRQSSDKFNCFENVTLSPDGRYMLLSKTGGESGNETYREWVDFLFVNLDTAQMYKIENLKGINFNVVWMPNGQIYLENEIYSLGA